MSLEYLDWNELIASHFFRSEKAGQPIYLYVTDSLINELGSDREGDLQDCINTLKTGVPWVTRHNQGICQKALQSWENWRDNPHYKSKYPPYIGYLALFILAAGIEGEGDFTANSYYPRLRYLLGEESKTGQYPSFEKMYQLWEDLEQWANEDINGEWGIFNCIRIGQNCHISFPLAQMLLTEEEQKNLPNIFAEADLDSLSIPSETAIAYLLSQHGENYLHTRTINLLKENDERRQVLIERIIEELNHWDGSVNVVETDSKIYYGNLRLCCKLDEIAGVAKMTLRCMSRCEWPEDDLVLSIEGNNETYFCSEDTMGWSVPLKLNSRNLDASQLDWNKRLKMRSPDKQWCFKFSGSPVRVLIKGQEYDLPGLIETSKLPKGKLCYLLVHQDHIEEIGKWANTDCQGFEKVNLNRGLPTVWNLFKVECANNDNLVKYKYPNLSFPSATRLYFQGGIRLDRGNHFFAFARPELLLQGQSEGFDIYIDCQDINLKLSPIALGVYQLPENLPLRQKISITVRQGENIFSRKNLTLIDDNPKNLPYPSYARDPLGSFIGSEDINSSIIRGTMVKGVDIPEFNFNTLLPIQGTNRIIFIGRKVGQIATPSEILEQDWTPIWAIASGRRSRIQFCGIDFNEVSPIAEKYGNRKQLKKWKKFLWHDRKVITPPKEQKLRCLWNKYQKEAKRV